MGNGTYSLSTLDHNGSIIRFTEVKGKPWYVATDIAEYLRFKNPYKAVKSIDDSMKLKVNCLVGRTHTNVVLTNEGGVMALSDLAKKSVAAATNKKQTKKQEHSKTKEVTKVESSPATGSAEQTTTDNDAVVNITINYTEDGTPYVSARELYQALGVESEFSHWFERMRKYGFTEGDDFSSKTAKSTGGRPNTEYYVTIDMAKELCMIQRTAKGKQCRQYFINLEKQWNTPEAILKRADKIKEKIGVPTEPTFSPTGDHEQAKKLGSQFLKFIGVDPNELVCTPKQLTVGNDAILVRDLAHKITECTGMRIRQTEMFEWMRKKAYLGDTKGVNYNQPTKEMVDNHYITGYYYKYGGANSYTPRITPEGQKFLIQAFAADHHMKIAVA